MFIKIIFCVIGIAATVSSQSIDAVINADGNVNNHADRVGLDIQTQFDHKENLTKALTHDLGVDKSLKVNIVRYNTPGSFDKNNPCHLKLTPCDRNYNSFIFSYPDCKAWERTGWGGPAGFKSFLHDIKVFGTKAFHLAGILYKSKDPEPHDDSSIWNLTEQEAADAVKQTAVDWVRWNKQNDGRIKYWEIGNEDNLGTCNEALAKLCPAETYAKYAKQIAMAIKEADPDAQVGINGTVAGPAESWFEAIYKAEPDINSYIDFFVAHVYCYWYSYDVMKGQAWGCSGMSECVDYLNRHFPDGDIRVTEFSAHQSDFDNGNNGYHWRSVMIVRILWQIFQSSPHVKSATMWPSRWGGGYAPAQCFFGDGYTLTPMGKGLSCYTKFMRPRMVASKKEGTFQYFALKDTLTNDISVYLINGSESAVAARVTINNFAAATINNEHWRLYNDANNPHAYNDTKLDRDGSVTVSGSGARRSFAVNVLPISVSVIAFGDYKNAGNPVIARMYQSEMHARSSAEGKAYRYDISGRQLDKIRHISAPAIAGAKGIIILRDGNGAIVKRFND